MPVNPLRRSVVAPLLCIALALPALAIGSPNSGVPGPRTLTSRPPINEGSGQERWAVVIGVSAHTQPELNLRYAANDARAVVTALKEHCGFQDDHVRLLVDGEATALAIRTALGTWLRTMANPNDLVVIYFSGHGAAAADTRGVQDGVRKYLVSHDADPDNLFATAVPFDDLSAALMNIQSERTVILLDTCYSGGAAVNGTALPRTIGPEGGGFTDQSAREFFDPLALSGRGRAVLTASAPTERSFEYDDLKHGLFTYHLLRGLSGHAAAPGTDLTVNSLYEYVYRQMRTPGGGRRPQTPMLTTSVAGPLILSASERRPAEGSGHLTVTTSPLGQPVFLDKERMPRHTPFEVTIPPGIHQISVISDGYLPVQQEIYVRAGQQNLVSVVLQTQPKEGDLLIRTAAGASIEVDGAAHGVVSKAGLLRVADLAAGLRRVTVALPDRPSVTREVDIRPGRATVLHVEPPSIPVNALRAPSPADLVPGLIQIGEGYIWRADGAEMVFVPGGPCLIGDDADAAASPRHQVTLRSFWIDKLEVTNERFDRFVTAAGHRVEGRWKRAPAGEARRPAVGVSLNDARAYAAWSGKQIPDEAQWEKAARGTDGRRYPYGDAIDLRRQNTHALGLRELTDAGSLTGGASIYGALDLLGNAWEWCDSLFAPYPGNNKPVEGFGRQNHVIRGGSFQSPRRPGDLTVSTRYFLRASMSQQDVGFRCIVPAPN